MESQGLSGAPLKAGEDTLLETEPSIPAFSWDGRGLEVAKSNCPALPQEETEGRGTSPLQMIARRWPLPLVLFLVSPTTAKTKSDHCLLGTA